MICKLPVEVLDLILEHLYTNPTIRSLQCCSKHLCMTVKDFRDRKTRLLMSVFERSVTQLGKDFDGVDWVQVCLLAKGIRVIERKYDGFMDQRLVSCVRISHMLKFSYLVPLPIGCDVLRVEYQIWFQPRTLRTGHAYIVHPDGYKEEEMGYIGEPYQLTKHLLSLPWRPNVITYPFSDVEPLLEKAGFYLTEAEE